MKEITPDSNRRDWYWLMTLYKSYLDFYVPKHKYSEDPEAAKAETSKHVNERLLQTTGTMVGSEGFYIVDMDKFLMVKMKNDYN